MSGFADALDLEAAWLAATGDGLPDLTLVFDTIQARYPRTPARKGKQLYVLHRPIDSSRLERTTNQRAMWTHNLQLKLVWPITNSTGSAEKDQLAFEQAIEQTVTRVMDLVGDHTHGGRFLSAAEDPDRIQVQFPDPEAALLAKEYVGFITYTVDDFETTN